MDKNMYKKGYSLLEVLVVVTLIAILSTIATQSINLSLISARKSGATIHVRENLEFAVAVMERQIRSAKSVSCSGNRLNYSDASGVSTYFQCNTSTGYVASGSATARITGNDVLVTSCQFSCVPATISTPPAVDISMTGESKEAAGSEKSQITVETRILLRVY